jgi:hypothetical protein
VQWVFIVIFNVLDSLSREFTLHHLIIEPSSSSKKERWTLVKFWVEVVGKLLIWLAVVAVTHISLLLLLMPAVVLYVAELVLALSLRVLTFLRTRL